MPIRPDRPDSLYTLHATAGRRLDRVERSSGAGAHTPIVMVNQGVGINGGGSAYSWSYSFTLASDLISGVAMFWGTCFTNAPQLVLIGVGIDGAYSGAQMTKYFNEASSHGELNPTAVLIGALGIGSHTVNFRNDAGVFTDTNDRFTAVLFPS